VSLSKYETSTSVNFVLAPTPVYVKPSSLTFAFVKMYSGSDVFVAVLLGLSWFMASVPAL